MPDKQGRVIQARIVKAYAKRAPNEMNLFVGDEVLVLDASNSAMWFGQVVSRSDKKNEVTSGSDPTKGWFPASNCVPLGAPQKPNHPATQSSKGGVRLSMRLDSSTFRNQFNSLLGDPGIIVGTAIAGAPSPRLRKHARALHDYQAQSNNEISLNQGDIVSIISAGEQESWWEGETEAGQIGFFPRDYIVVFRDPLADSGLTVASPKKNQVLAPEFDDTHALAIIAQVILAHEPVVPFNDSGLPFLRAAEGAVVALLDSNPNHLYWLVAQFDNHTAPLQHTPNEKQKPASKSANSAPPRVGLIPKANLAVFEGLGDPHSNYPFTPIAISATRYLANRAVGSVSSADGQVACLARVAFEFHGENENEHEYLGVGDLVWVIDEDETIRTEPWVEVEIDTKRGFCPTTFLEILSDRVQAPKPDVVLELGFNQPANSSPPSSDKDPASKEKKPKSGKSDGKETKDGKAQDKKKKKKSADKDDAAEKDAQKSKGDDEASTGPVSTSSATLARALYAYNAESESELTLNVGDIIRLIDYPPGEEWWEGILAAPDGSPLAEEYIGFFPRDYVVILKEEKKKEKKRPKRGATTKSKSKKAVTQDVVSAPPPSVAPPSLPPIVEDHPKQEAPRSQEMPAPAKNVRSTARLSKLPEEIFKDQETVMQQLDITMMELEMKQAELEMAQAELDTKAAELELNTIEMNSMKVVTERQETEIETLKAEKAALQRTVDQFESKAQQASSKHSSKVEELQAENEKMKAELAKLKGRAEASEARETKLKEQVAALTKQLDDEHKQAAEKAKQQQTAAVAKQTAAQRKASTSTPPAGPPPSGPPSGPPPGPTQQPPASNTQPNGGNATQAAPAAASPRKEPAARPVPPSIATGSTSASDPAPLASPTSGPPDTPKGRNLPPTPAGGAPPQGGPPKNAPPNGPPRTMPKQPAPSLPSEFVKKTAVPKVAVGAAKKAALGTPSPHSSGAQPGPSKPTAAKASTAVKPPAPSTEDEFSAKRRFFENLKR